MKRAKPPPVWTADIGTFPRGWTHDASPNASYATKKLAASGAPFATRRGTCHPASWRTKSSNTSPASTRISGKFPEARIASGARAQGCGKPVSSV